MNYYQCLDNIIERFGDFTKVPWDTFSINDLIEMMDKMRHVSEKHDEFMETDHDSEGHDDEAYADKLMNICIEVVNRLDERMREVLQEYPEQLAKWDKVSLFRSRPPDKLSIIETTRKKGRNN